jgi:hypothetical protein
MVPSYKGRISIIVELHESLESSVVHYVGLEVLNSCDFRCSELLFYQLLLLMELTVLPLLMQGVHFVNLLGKEVPSRWCTSMLSFG